jgi:hypothetical protein
MRILVHDTYPMIQVAAFAHIQVAAQAGFHPWLSWAKLEHVLQGAWTETCRRDGGLHTAVGTRPTSRDASSDTHMH